MSLPLRYAVGGVALAIILNLLLRSFVKVGGIFATLLIAAATAALLALAFRFIQRRAPEPRERWRIVLGYGGLLGLLYLGLLAMMTLQDTPSPMGVLLFLVHYLCYPVMAALLLSERVLAKSR
jgi:drug/metabolite transporter (DMT)-like permease